ncbi:hypothetical protein [Limnoglobus roseus]|uniref:Uncharacterized protein n=1 Tax=Limnoglobus roseus TaxID=2598579 RepID=A0A5C1AKE4_9BACT|nr:hypothetical protein [Limnoglobus roseus]QEL18627.1 hypothetical protein PX52LOC_05660 [Limnoglobus roseus]
MTMDTSAARLSTQARDAIAEMVFPAVKRFCETHAPAHTADDSGSAAIRPAAANSTNCTTWDALPPPSAMDNNAIAAELAGLFTLSLSVLKRAGDLLLEANRRGLKIQFRSVVFGEWLPAIAAGKLSAELVSSMADAPKALRALAKFPPAEQVKLAADDHRIAVVKEVGQSPHAMSV